MKPFFSVIIPSVGRPELREAVESVLAQKFEDFEIIVVLDGPVQSPKLAADVRVRVEERAHSGGAGAARNTGIRAAKGRWILFLDDDDLYAPDRLERFAREVKAHRDQILLSWSDYWSRGCTMPAKRRVLDGWANDHILDSPIPSVGTVAVPKALVCEFDSNYQTSEDVEWWLRQAARCEVHTVQMVSYYVRVHEGSRLTDTTDRKLRSRLQLLDQHREYFRHHPRAAAYHWKRAAGMAMALGEHAVARRAWTRCIRASPTLRHFGGYACSVIGIRDPWSWRVAADSS